ncbi:hypothetical protein [Micromonospora sp. WMMD737]|uniref:hypothetical protein n=1 Tax=Micromonospora sp. WMMD737 TaxID=3404113 RepID=UPI003B94CF00
MKLRQFGFIAALTTAAWVSGSGVHPPLRELDGRPVGAVEVVDLNGLRDIEFGDTEDELTRRGILRSDVDACGPALAGYDTTSPIFVDDRLVLLWLGEATRTPQGVTAGMPVEEVRSRYPSLRELDAPQGTYRLDGLLARQGDRAYLFLHDGRAVKKIIAGYADWAQRLFDEGHSPC